MSRGYVLVFALIRCLFALPSVGGCVFKGIYTCNMHTARVQATQAVLRYLGVAAQKHPALWNMQYDKACHA